MTIYVREAKTSNYFRAIVNETLHKSKYGHLYVDMNLYPISKTAYYSKPKNKRMTVTSAAIQTNCISEADNRAVLYYLLGIEI